MKMKLERVFPIALPEGKAGDRGELDWEQGAGQGGNTGGILDGGACIGRPCCICMSTGMAGRAKASAFEHCLTLGAGCHGAHGMARCGSAWCGLSGLVGVWMATMAP